MSVIQCQLYKIYWLHVQHKRMKLNTDCYRQLKVTNLDKLIHLMSSTFDINRAHHWNSR